MVMAELYPIQFNDMAMNTVINSVPEAPEIKPWYWNLAFDLLGDKAKRRRIRQESEVRWCA